MPAHVQGFAEKNGSMAKKKAKSAGANGKTAGAKKPASKPATKTASKAPAQKTGKEARHRWTFLTNHSHVLILIHADPTLVLREMAARVGITERAIQQILHDLEEGGFIEREKIGRQNHYRVLTDQALRHPVESHCSIADLLSLVVDHPRANSNEWL